MCATRLSLRKLSIGAQVIGLNPGDEVHADVQQWLYAAWLEHGILLFDHVDTIARHLALSRCFGELELHPFPEVRSDEDPLLIEIGGHKRSRAHVYDEGVPLANRIAWHRDTAYTPDICKGAMLRMVEVPARGGETLFADTALAYDDLPAELRARLDRLEYRATLRLSPLAQTRPGAFWRTVRPATLAEDPSGGVVDVEDAAIVARYPSVVHPVVLVHPESGRKCLFLSPTYVDCFLGLSQRESDELLDYLVSHMLQPRYVYRHTWSVDQAIVWDNRRCMHAALGNTLDQPRRGLRTTLAGALRTGRYFDEDARAMRKPFAD